MPFLGRNVIVLAKIETTYGTDSVPTGAANAILCMEADLQPLVGGLKDRTLINTFMGGNAALPGAFNATLRLKVEMAGPGAAGSAAPYGPLLRACARSETLVASTTATYNPVSTAHEAVSIYFSLEGVRHRLLGVRGDCTMMFALDAVPYFEFNLTGLVQTVADVAAPTPTYTGFTKPLIVSNANTTPFTLHGYSAVMSEMSINIGNNVIFRSLVGGAESVLIVGRNTTGSISVEAVLVATKDWFGIAKAGTVGAIDITHGTAAGNKVQITSSGVQLQNPRYVDQNGVMMLQMDMLFTPVAAAGNDEIAIVVK